MTEVHTTKGPAFPPPGLKPSRIRAVAKVAAPHFHSHACQRLKGLKPLKHLLASSSILHSVKLLKATQRKREQLGGCKRDETSRKGVCISLIYQTVPRCRALNNCEGQAVDTPELQGSPE
ncbi:hypothetical protein AMECASPLE_003067 [Ameca splendens]|uniref:Uncharacterized protein n=1 Tax=Ameca splendens TaxID=208324 RepID=A0ABV0XBI4_9TELE